MPQPIDHPFVLILTCVYEMTRQTSIGPTLHEIKTLLSAVYGVNDMPHERLEQITASLCLHYIELDQTSGRYYPNIAGVFLFSALKPRIIPPQTVALPRRRQT